MRPYDCGSKVDEMKLDHQGISHNRDGIELDYGRVIITVGACKLTVPGRMFRYWCDWYMDDQDEICKERKDWEIENGFAKRQDNE